MNQTRTAYCRKENFYSSLVRKACLLRPSRPVKAEPGKGKPEEMCELWKYDMCTNLSDMARVKKEEKRTTEHIQV